MKKVFCISLIVLHLLNVVGCYWIFSAIQKRSRQALSQQLDTGSYAGSQTITIKLPMSSFEEDAQSNYERVDGDFVYENVTYRMVKQKFYQDTAYIVCYKDERTIAIRDALNDYVKTLADTPVEKKSESKAGFSLIKDYLHDDRIVLPSFFTIKNDSNTFFLDYSRLSFDIDIDYPPRLIG